VSIELRPDGPHSPEYTRQIAALFAESVRVLNHATAPWQRSGLAYPSDAYGVLGDLAHGVGLLPQLLQQLTAFLERQTEAGHVGEDEYGPHGGDPIAALAAVESWLQQATAAAGQLSAALQRAHSAVGGLHHLDQPTVDGGTAP